MFFCAQQGCFREARLKGLLTIFGNTPFAIFVKVKRSQMRVRHSALFLTLFAGLSSQAMAADYDWLATPVLRGSVAPPTYVPGRPVYQRWSGFYFGGQIGAMSGEADFSNATKSQIKYILANTELEDPVSNWRTLPVSASQSMKYGGFVGYNVQWGEAITGFELNYNHLSFFTSVADTIGPIAVPGATRSDGSTVQYGVNLTSTASISIHDIVTGRARFGWAAGSFLPYGFIGAAVGNAHVSRTATLAGSTITVTPPPTIDPISGITIPGTPVTSGLALPRDPQGESRNVIAYGYTAGLGLDYQITPSLFLRGEWEYIKFLSINDVRMSMHSVHAGVGFRF